MTTTSEVCQTKNPPAKHLLQIETLRAPPEMKYIITRQCDISNQTNHDLHWNSHWNSSELSPSRPLGGWEIIWFTKRIEFHKIFQMMLSRKLWFQKINVHYELTNPHLGLIPQIWFILRNPNWGLFRIFDSATGAPIEACSANLIQQPPDPELRLIPQIGFNWRYNCRFGPSTEPYSANFRMLALVSQGNLHIRLIPQISLDFSLFRKFSGKAPPHPVGWGSQILAEFCGLSPYAPTRC